MSKSGVPPTPQRAAETTGEGRVRAILCQERKKNEQYADCSRASSLRPYDLKTLALIIGACSPRIRVNLLCGLSALCVESFFR
jgi:hypothetical protein